jgi:hypothetical protein
MGHLFPLLIALCTAVACLGFYVGRRSLAKPTQAPAKPKNPLLVPDSRLYEYRAL